MYKIFWKDNQSTLFQKYQNIAINYPQNIFLWSFKTNGNSFIKYFDFLIVLLTNYRTENHSIKILFILFIRSCYLWFNSSTVIVIFQIHSFYPCKVTLFLNNSWYLCIRSDVIFLVSFLFFLFFLQSRILSSSNLEGVFGAHTEFWKNWNLIFGRQMDGGFLKRLIYCFGYFILV